MFFFFVLEFQLVYELTLVFVTTTLKCKIKLEKNTQEKIKKTALMLQALRYNGLP